MELRAWASIFARPQPPRGSVLAILFLAGCTGPTTLGDGGSSFDARTSEDAGDGDTSIPIEWAPCSLIQGMDDGLAECANVALPLTYGSSSSFTFQVRVKRLRSQEPRTGQLWLLDGGPGGSAVASMGARMAELEEATQGIDVLTFDHRGAGFSQRLGCPNEEAADSPGGQAVLPEEWTACIDDVRRRRPDLPAITTSAAARDLGALIDLTTERDLRVFIWGISYGTYQAHRFAQIFPDRVDGIIIEGIVPPGTTWSMFDREFDAKARAFFERCGSEAFCADRLTSDPWSYVQAVIDSVDRGVCNIGIDGRLLGQVLGLLLYNSDLRELVPALVYRINRCAPGDLAAIARMYEVLNRVGTGGGSITLANSPILANHIWSSEFWPAAGPPLTQLEADAAACTICLGSGPRIASIYDRWPRYGRDAFHGMFAPHSGPMLMLQGGLDPATTLERAQVMEARFAGPGQHFVVFDESTHGISGHTPTTSGTDCGLDLVAQFTSAPTEPLDLSCVAEVRPIDFRGSPVYSERLFGTADPWGDHE